MTKMHTDKLIVSNFDKLKQKYGSAGAKQVHTAVTKLIKADAARGIGSRLVDLSDAATMAKCGIKPLLAKDATNDKRNKQAIDAIYKHGEIRPAYLMLLGSKDVIPYVSLANPAAGDGDADLPSDLPYATDKPYSQDVQDFIAPTRVVGRLPNVTNDTNPAYLIRLLQTATTYKAQPVQDYLPYLGISAEVWTKSTELSLDAIFGSHAKMKISPPDGPKWTAAEAKPLAHFINCHGAAGDPNYYGQKGASYPVAHEASWMASKVVPGTVLAAECCYGAELYDPAVLTAAGQMPMCNTYLGNKAFAFFGSTNIAYGPTAANDQADLMCQYFAINLGSGASCGRACLQARLNYVLAKGSVLTPTDLKTLGQFTLIADPSLTPVALPPREVLATQKAKPSEASAAVARHSRSNRRAGLFSRAEAVRTYRLREYAPASSGKGTALGKLRQLAAQHGIKPDVIISYAIGAPSQSARAKGFTALAEVSGPGPKAVHTVLERVEPPKEIPHLVLVRGVEGIEYTDGIDARLFESR